MGRLLARFFARRGFDVSIQDPAGGPRGFALAGVGSAADADVVVVAAALEHVAEAMESVLGARPSGLVFDIASVKAPLLGAIRRARRAGVSIASVHPMFGPGVASLEGRDLVVCDAGDADAARRVTRLFHGAGLSIRTMPIAEHDPWIAKTMGLAHFVAIAAAATLARSGVDPREVSGRASTSFRRLLEFVEPFLEQAPELTWAIQEANPHARAALARFQREIEAWRRAAFAPTPAAFRRKAARLSRELRFT